MSSKRRIDREKVLQALYAYELSQEPIAMIIDNIVVGMKKQPEAFTFAKALIHKVIEQKEEIDKRIKEKVTNWEFNRIAVIDKLLLRIGICELMYFDDIPPKVSINEAIEIAKRYSTENSGRFVNGVLDSVLTDLKKSDQLHKSGRGLVNSSTRSSKKKKSPERS